MAYNPYKNWEPRQMPTPMKLMRLVNGTGTDAQTMYYSMMGMKKTDFDVANAAVEAMSDLRRGGMDPYMLDGIDDVCKAITKNDIEGMNAGIKRITDVLVPFCDMVEKASKKDDEPEEDDEKDKDDDTKAPEKDKEPSDAPEDDDGPEVDIAIEEAPDDVPPEAPKEAPIEVAEMPVGTPAASAIDMRSIMAGPQVEQVAAIDPALVLKALQMLQSIGQMC